MGLKTQQEGQIGILDNLQFPEQRLLLLYKLFQFLCGYATFDGYL